MNSAAVHSTPVVIGGGRRRPARLPASLGRALVYALAVLASLVMGVYVGTSHDNPTMAGVMAGMALVLPLIWQRPVVGVYVLIGGAAVFETFVLGFPDSITDQVPFFLNWSSAGGPGFVIATTAEMLMVFALGAVVLKRMSVGATPLELGPMFWGVALYTGMVMFGLVYGVGTGGNYFDALWEARAQIYLFLMYLLVVNTVGEARQVDRILWVLLIGIAIKGVIGTWRYVVTLGMKLDNVAEIASTNSILAHEASYLFALFFIFGFILFMFRGNRGQLWFIALAGAPVAVAFLANQRRVGTLVLGVGVLLVMVLAYRLVRSRRRAIVTLAAIMAVLLPIYLAAAWNGTGVVAEPARAVKSAFQPSKRDEGSNNYRELEALNLKYNVGINPIIGRGYGKPINFYIPMPYIGDIFVWWDLIPHNTVLWVWMRLGIVGFFAFWFLIGRSLIGSALATRRVSSPQLRSVGVFTIVAIVTWVVMGTLDMGLVDYRETILIGSLIGIAGRLPEMERPEADAQTERGGRIS